MNPGSVTNAPAASPSASRDVDATRVAEWLTTGQCTLIDVREADEFAREQVAEAKLLPLSQFNPAAIDTLRAGATTNRVVLMCKSGRRSGDALRQCLANRAATGHLEVVAMAGGIEAWKSRGLPTVSNTKGPVGGAAGLGVLQQTQIAIGVLTLTGMAVGMFAHPIGYVLPVVTGCGLIMAGTTGFCPLATLIGMMPWNRIAETAPHGSSSPATRTDSCCNPASQPTQQ